MSTTDAATSATRAAAATSDTAATGASTKATTPAARFCPTCHQRVKAFKPGGVRRRPNAKCPRCGALERHRFLAVLLEGLGPVIAHTGAVLDIAPSRYTTRHLDHLAPGHYVRMDLDPDADGRAVDVQASLTHLPFAPGSFDLILCYHVLEHVPDDASAMRELARVLKPGGVALVQVPFKPDRPTDEDPGAPEQERIERFGQADHVRWYGHDFEDRLEAAGLRGPRITPQDVLGDDLVAAFGVKPAEAVWILRSAAQDGASTSARATDDDGADAVTPLAHDRAWVGRREGPSNHLLTGLAHLEDPAGAAEVERLRKEASRLRRERDHLREQRDKLKQQRDVWRARHERITRNPVVRTLAAPYRALRRR